MNKIALIVLCCLACSWSEVGAAPTPKVDSRGYVDVWQLRRDLAEIEPLIADESADSCGYEADDGDDGVALTAKQKKAQHIAELKEQEAEKRCEADVAARYQTYVTARTAFNQAWLPVLLNAVRHGDTVAEVILLRCDTTPILERDRMASTCADSPTRSRAYQRLRDIGFAPAFDWQDQLKPVGSDFFLPDLLRNQAVILDAYKSGATGLNDDPGDVADDSGNAIYYGYGTGQPMAAVRSSAVIEAVLQDIPRVFTLAWSDAYQAPRSLSTLAINRSVWRPAEMSWGPALLNNGVLERTHSEESFWKSEPGRHEISCKNGGSCLIQGSANIDFGLDRRSEDERWMPGSEYVGIDTNFVPLLQTLLADEDANIRRYLRSDPRWGVFLLNRVGHHEWVPQGLVSDSATIDSSWQGHYVLQQHFAGRKQLSDASGSISIATVAGVTRATISTTPAQGRPLRDVQACPLRYSGGSILQGVFRGDPENADPPASAYAALDGRTHYKQVLLQCLNAEMPSNDRVRFLILAKDTLLEFAAESPHSRPLHIRQYRRAP